MLMEVNSVNSISLDFVAVGYLFMLGGVTVDILYEVVLSSLFRTDVRQSKIHIPMGSPEQNVGDSLLMLEDTSTFHDDE